MSTHKEKGSRIALFVIIGIVSVLLAIYLGITAFFQSHYLFHTTIGTVSCGTKTPEFVENRNINHTKDYLLTIYDRENNKFHLQGSSIGYAYVSKGEEARILAEQNPFTWPASIFRTYEYPLISSNTYDVASLEKAISEMEFMSADYITSPKNASLVLTEEGYEVIPEEDGNQPISSEVEKTIQQAIDKQEVSVTLPDSCYAKPEITSDDPSITNTTHQIDQYLASTIHYEIGEEMEDLSAKDIIQMLIVDDQGNVSVDDNKIASFVQKMASKYNTYGDEREFKTSLGSTVTIGGGDYGWVIAKAKEADAIKNHLGTGEAETREPIYEQTAKVPGLNDIGNTYVELDYSNQHMYYYKEGNLVFESDIVSGKISNGNGSPDGVYKIVYKKSPSVLVGETYETTVQYFVPFAYNVGFHDATWQPTFGGDRYLTYGSHGCINMPLEKAAEFYNIIETGTPVVAYYRTPVQLTSESAQISNAYSYTAPEKPAVSASSGTAAQ